MNTKSNSRTNGGSRSVDRLGRWFTLCAEMWRGYYDASRAYGGSGIIYACFNATRLALWWIAENPPTVRDQGQLPAEETSTNRTDEIGG